MTSLGQSMEETLHVKAIAVGLKKQQLCFTVNNCSLEKSFPRCTFLSLQIWHAVGRAAGEAGHTSLEFLGLHNSGFVYDCFCKSPLKLNFCVLFSWFISSQLLCSDISSL